MASAGGMAAATTASSSVAAATAAVLRKGAAAQNDGGESAAQQGGEFRRGSTFHNVTNSIQIDQVNMNQPSTAAAEIGGRSSPFCPVLSRRIFAMLHVNFDRTARRRFNGFRSRAACAEPRPGG